MHKSSFILILCSVLFHSCQNKITTEMKAVDCTPVIANPRMGWYSLNDCNLSAGLSSEFTILLDKYGDCITSASPFTIVADFYDASGLLVNTISFNVTNPLLGDEVRLAVCLRFGTEDTKYVKFSINCVGSNAQKSNTVSFVVNRPVGAN